MKITSLLFLLRGLIEIRSTLSTMSSLEKFAINAVSKYPDSHIEIAMDFASNACPAFVGQDNDRLVKVGRSLQSLVLLKDKIPLEASVQQLVDECNLLCSGAIKVCRQPLCRNSD